MCQHFNELRSDMVLLYELKLALATCEYELQTLRHQYEVLVPEKTAVAAAPAALGPPPAELVTAVDPPSRGISEILDVGGTPGTPNVSSGHMTSLYSWSTPGSAC